MKIENLVVTDRCKTRIDHLLSEAIKTAESHGLSIRNIVPKRVKGLIVGYYVINEGGETALTEHS